MTPHIKLLLVEPQVLVREALKCLLQTVDGMVVVGETGGATGLLTAVESKRPDVVVVAIDGVGDSELALLQELPNVAERTRTLVLSADPDPSLHARAIELGALGLVMKTESAQVLVKAVQKVYAGEALARSHADGPGRQASDPPPFGAGARGFENRQPDGA